MMFKNNYRMARNSLRASRWRSFLTMLGVIIGIVAVVTVLSIGEGIKQSITAEAESLGPDVVTVLPGRQIEHQDGLSTSFNPFASVGHALNQTDVKEIRQIDEGLIVVPFVRVSGIPTVGDVTMPDATIIAADGDAPAVLNREIRFGSWFSDDSEVTRDFVVIGSQVAGDLFNEMSPIGRPIDIGNRSVTVRGVFEEFPRSPLPFMSIDYNKAIFVSYDDNVRRASNGTHIFQILAQANNNIPPAELSDKIEKSLLASRDGAHDFTVLQRSEMINVYGEILDVITTAIAVIAGISLFVGGIGIMNIMFVSVSERTAEIGIRKAIGATNSQILGQFITEAMVLSFLGGIFGVLGSLLVNYFVRLFTVLEPVIAPELMVLAIVTALVVGVIFGTAPAIRAARKDPIDALRYRI